MDFSISPPTELKRKNKKGREYREKKKISNITCLLSLLQNGQRDVTEKQRGDSFHASSSSFKCQRLPKKETTLSAESVSLTIQMQTVSQKTHLKHTYSFLTLTVVDGGPLMKHRRKTFVPWKV